MPSTSPAPSSKLTPRRAPARRSRTSSRAPRAPSAAAQDRDAIGEVEDLTHPVRDVEDARAAAPDLAHDLQQLVDLGVRQHRRGFVEDEYAAAALPALQC